ncbi:hypothetical protein E1B28_003128 [Marasmius oreades]|uniref:Uncharacterized protein n=1 Tax=Marasmius oreades TaxID=181124 RepID=A0A9P7RL83_9AGAR|nr:uncharacterized protein E1B28_003128 [Marasmius oreades]KAG7085572.1 hypothetical protein E1B28_003128 [Marasmius oreades]
MSKESLPLKVRADIRDLWDSPNSSLHESIVNLEKTLGHRIAAEAEWLVLWSSLQARFPDKSTFVPTVTRYAITWYERLLVRLEDDNHAAWIEELLNVLVECKRLSVLKVEPCQSDKNTTPYMTWDANFGSFCLGIPTSDPSPSFRLAAILDGYFDNLFSGEARRSAAEDDDWADVAVVEEKPLPPPSKAPAAHPAPTEERLPNVDTLARPNELFKAITHIMVIKSHREDPFRNFLTVECSHQQSLELMSAYLTKWAKTNASDSLRRPVFKIELFESDFSPGILDILRIEPNMTYKKDINPTIVLAFVEGVLGYGMVHADTTSGSTWMYRSTTLFK